MDVMEQQQRQTPMISSVRRNCDFCVKKKVKCRGSIGSKGCFNCQRKGVKCVYSLKRKPGPKCRKRGASDKRSKGGSFLSGKGPPMTPPSFDCFSSSSSTAISRFGPPFDDSLGASRFEGGAGSSSVRRAYSSGSQLSQTVPQAGGSLGGAGVGRSGSMIGKSSSNDISNGGEPFIFALEGEELNLATLFDQLDGEVSGVWGSSPRYKSDEKAGIGAISRDRKHVVRGQDRGSRKRKKEMEPGVVLGDDVLTRCNDSLGSEIVINDAELVSPFGRERSQSEAGIHGGEDDTGNFGSGPDFRRQQSMRHLRQDSQMKLQHLQQQRLPLLFESPYSPHRHAHEHHCPHRQFMSADSSGSLVGVDAAMLSQQQQQQQQQQNNRPFVGESLRLSSVQSFPSPPPGFGSGDMAGGGRATGQLLGHHTRPVPCSHLLHDNFSLWGVDTDGTTLQDVGMPPGSDPHAF